MSGQAPCNCEESISTSSSDLQLPSLDEFELKLQAISASRDEFPMAADTIDLEGLEQGLAELESPSSLEAGGDALALGDLLRFLEYHPGLKISLSY